MEFDTLSKIQHSRLSVKVSRKDCSSEPFSRDVLVGLSSTPKTLPPKYFYDETGSRLFEDICELPEYYPTRTERAIIRRYAEEISILSQKDCALIELGSGSSAKTRLLIEAFLRRSEKLHYIPVDISKNILVESSKALLQDYEQLRITALASDYLTALRALKRQQIDKKLIAFLGSTIGNFDEKDRLEFLREIRESMNPQDRLLLGADLIKGRDILEPAYDDARGVTAKFNLNLLVRINRELDADFDLDLFRHKAFLNEDLGRIEMHLQSTAKQSVTIDKLGQSFKFARDETIHTENSYKFSKEQIKELARVCGFELKHSWYDENQWFSLNLLKPNEPF
ncbi:MAG: L-histidine N(alpha)-methyltransferase [bacterium]